MKRTQLEKYLSGKHCLKKHILSSTSLTFWDNIPWRTSLRETLLGETYPLMKQYYREFVKATFPLAQL